jgi:uncharacterized membrane protein
LPIYGCGGVALILILRKFFDRPLLAFFLAMVVCGVIEYSGAWYLETFKHLKYWDYSGHFLNIQGRICLEGLIVFGAGGCLFIYILAPFFDGLLLKVPAPVREKILALLVVCFGSDLVYCQFHPHTGKGITER